MEEEYQKALNKVRDAVSFSDDEFGESKTSSNLDEELNLLEELVDKETPMKVCGDGEDHMCPKCNEYFCICEVQNKINYCPNCGQKLDWGE